MNELLKLLPTMKSGDDLFAALSELPDYDDTIRKQSQAERLIALSDLYKFYIPSPMTIEIYSKIYLALLRSLQKKTTRTTVLQQNENYRGLQRESYSGIIGGSDSFTIIGTSGIGKSSAIDRSISLLTANGIIETEKPYRRIIPCIAICYCNLRKKLCFILRTNFATRRTLVRLRASKIKSEALILLSLSVLHLFFLSPKKGLQKNLRFFTAPVLFAYRRVKYLRYEIHFR